MQAAAGIDIALWRDPWNQPITWTFPIEATDYAIVPHSAGEPPTKAAPGRDPINLVSIELPWFQSRRTKVQQALNTWTQTHPYPTSQPELSRAIQSLGPLLDPWHRPLYATFRTRALFTDRVTTHAQADAGQIPTLRTTITPVTEQVDTIQSSSVASIENRIGILGGLPGGMYTGGRLPSSPPPPPSPGFGTPRVRDYFPETLLWRPEVLTSPVGQATIRFPVADSITAWNLEVAASTLHGNTGAGAATFTTALPFFAALDPPKVLTEGDRIALPIPLRNYLPQSVTVHSDFAPEAWFTLNRTIAPITIAPQTSATVTADLTVCSSACRTVTAADPERTPAPTTLYYTATPDSAPGDSIVRPITIHPNGEETALTAAAILQPDPTGKGTTLTLTVPPDTLPNTADLTLKLYPNLAARLRDALTTMAAYPHGCAEQTISLAWPSLLLARYTLQTASLQADPSDTQSSSPVPPDLTREGNPQSHSSSSPDQSSQSSYRHNLEQAYANLLANFAPAGGLRYWPTDPRPDQALTAYAVQFLLQARPFIAVDEDLLKRQVTWLTAQQAASGLWIRQDRDGAPHPEDTSANTMLTASIAALLAEVPGAEASVRKALDATAPNLESPPDPYTQANFAQAALALKDPAAEPALALLRKQAHTEDGASYWNLETNTPFYGWGRAGRVESTAAAIRALQLAANPADQDLIARGLLFLFRQQDRQNLWYSTQATARTLDVLARTALAQPITTRQSSTLAVTLDGAKTLLIPLPPADQDAGPQTVPIPGALLPGPHQITLTLPPGASPATAQLVADLYLPWPRMGLHAPSAQAACPLTPEDERGRTPPPRTTCSTVVNSERLTLSQTYSTTHPTSDTPVRVTAHLERIGFRGYGMLVAELGLPPGADIDRATLDLAQAASHGSLNHYEVLPDRILLYLWPRAGGLDLRYAFTIRYPIDALSSPSTLYDNYNPDARTTLPPSRFTTFSQTTSTRGESGP